MSFDTKQFPNKVFENFEEYFAYIELRKKIIDRLKHSSEEGKVRVLKVASILKKDSQELQQILLWILSSLKT
jgi:hypothetical protein